MCADKNVLKRNVVPRTLYTPFKKRKRCTLSRNLSVRKVSGISDVKTAYGWVSKLLDEILSVGIGRTEEVS